MIFMFFKAQVFFFLILLHSERPKLYTILAFLSAIGFIQRKIAFEMHALPSFFFSDEQFDQNGEKN